jgi:hypothetical protein
MITLGEAETRYGVRTEFDLDDVRDDAEVLLLPGGEVLDRLPLDFRDLDSWSGLVTEEDRPAFAGLIVDGDLTVAGSVTNWEMDFGPFLLVRGALRARNVATAGSQVVVRGSLNVTQTLAGFYNHGSTIVRGDTRAEVVATIEHLIRLHGRLDARLVVAGSFLEIADPAATRVGAWVDRVHGLDGTVLDGLGGPSRKALRLLDPEFADVGQREIWAAAAAGRSLLRPDPVPTAPEPSTAADAVRATLRRAGCAEQGRFDDGFCLARGDDEPVGVYFCSGDEHDDGLDPDTELRRYTDALAAAGYRVDVDAVDPDVLRVRR